MRRTEFIEFQYQLLESMRSEILDNYDLEEKNDIDQEYFDKISKMIDTLKSIKIKEI